MYVKMSTLLAFLTLERPNRFCSVSGLPEAPARRSGGVQYKKR
jgi:hypothetical protein